MRGRCDKCGQVTELVYKFERNDMSTGRITLWLCYECGYTIQEFILTDERWVKLGKSESFPVKKISNSSVETIMEEE